jgi:hypothetical protein
MPTAKEEGSVAEPTATERTTTDLAQCEVTSVPPCSRCVRLKLQCSGYGERRLKFQDESKKFALRNRKNVSPASSVSKNSLPDARTKAGSQLAVQKSVLVPPIPTNALTTLTRAFTHCMNAQGPDTSFHLIWNYGGFLADVPRHLGRNESLDRVSDALVMGYSHFRRARRMTADPVCLDKYAGALRGLRRSLVTTETACEAETLCAIMMLMVVEVSSNSSRDKERDSLVAGSAALLTALPDRPSLASPT